jgi:hypothetical protein
MKSPISDGLFIDYLQCKHKAYLKQTGKIGIKNDWVKYQESRNDNYRQRARAYFQQNHKLMPNLLSGPLRQDNKESSLRWSPIKPQRNGAAPVSNTP